MVAGEGSCMIFLLRCWWHASFFFDNPGNFGDDAHAIIVFSLAMFRGLTKHTSQTAPCQGADWTPYSRTLVLRPIPTVHGMAEARWHTRKTETRMQMRDVVHRGPATHGQRSIRYADFSELCSHATTSVPYIEALLSITYSGKSLRFCTSSC